MTSLPHRELGRTGFSVSALGFGGAPVGDLYELLDESSAVDTVVAAVESGVTLLDTSPWYGNGLSEHRIGTALRRTDSSAVRISTKAGRITDPFRPADGDSGFVGGTDHALAIDYSRDGALRALEQSMLRLGRSRIDLVLVHDLDRWTHGDDYERRYAEALEGTVPVLRELRAQGLIGGYGTGVNEAEAAERFARDCDPDAILLAGRYSLLEQPALESFLPFALERGIGVVLGGVYNSGILATGAVPGARYNYGAAPPTILSRVAAIEATCAGFDVPLRRAALHFALGHPAVSSVVLGAASAAEVRAQAADLLAEVPAALWDRLKDAGLLGESVPVPPADGPGASARSAVDAPPDVREEAANE